MVMEFVPANSWWEVLDRFHTTNEASLILATMQIKLRLSAGAHTRTRLACLGSPYASTKFATVLHSELLQGFGGHKSEIAQKAAHKKPAHVHI